jgi:hypothetical protein
MNGEEVVKKIDSNLSSRPKADDFSDSIQIYFVWDKVEDVFRVEKFLFKN